MSKPMTDKEQTIEVSLNGIVHSGRILSFRDPDNPGTYCRGIVRKAVWDEKLQLLVQAISHQLQVRLTVVKRKEYWSVVDVELCI